MDQQTLTNHLQHLSKSYFDVACRLVLQNVFNLIVINVDGPYDGGTDFSSFDGTGNRKLAVYQITTQKKDIEQKAYEDAEKAIKAYKPSRFYFMTSVNISETTSRKIENRISDTLGIQTICFGSKHIADFLLSESLLNFNSFLDETNYPLPRDFASSPDYKEMALHGYSLMSEDASGMKEGIYDETILLILSDHQEMQEIDILNAVVKHLAVNEGKFNSIRNRIGSLFGRQLIHRTQDGNICLSTKVLQNAIFVVK